MEIRFYSEASNPATYTPTAKWDAAGGKILKDLEARIRMLTKRGLRASDPVSYTHLLTMPHVSPYFPWPTTSYSRRLS